MIQSRRTPEETCIGCGIIFRPRSELDHGWRDARFCSSVCQRRGDTSAGGRTARRVAFPQGLGRIDGKD